MSRINHRLALAPVLGLALLGGCMNMRPFQKGDVKPNAQVQQTPSSFSQDDSETASDIMESLLSRKSVVPADSTLGSVADVALSSSTRTAEAELRTAKLRSEAEDKNWLPTIGPTVSLTSLGDVLAGIVVDQVLFDYGRKKGERDYAAADVEVAAVTLSQDMNERTFEAQSLYIEALRGREKVALSDRALTQMQAFRQIVAGRVAGGVSNKGDLRMVDDKIQTLRTTRETASDSGDTALSELMTMTGTTFQLAAVQPLAMERRVDVEPLQVLKASAQARRSVARATVERAAQLPGVGANVNISNAGTAGGVLLSSETGLGLGTGARLKAIESTKETAQRQVDEAREDAARDENRLSKEIRSLQRQKAEAESLAREGQETYRLFEAQFRAGQRAVLEVVDVYEQSARRELDGLDAGYDMILAQLELARDLGLLADGDAI